MAKEKELFIGVICFESLGDEKTNIFLIRADDREEATKELAGQARVLYPSPQMYELLAQSIHAVTRATLEAFMNGIPSDDTQELPTIQELPTVA